MRLHATVGMCIHGARTQPLARPQTFCRLPHVCRHLAFLQKTALTRTQQFTSLALHAHCDATSFPIPESRYRLQPTKPHSISDFLETQTQQAMDGEADADRHAIHVGSRCIPHPSLLRLSDMTANGGSSRPPLCPCPGDNTTACNSAITTASRHRVRSYHIRFTTKNPCICSTCCNPTHGAAGQTGHVRELAHACHVPGPRRTCAFCRATGPSTAWPPPL